MRARITARRCGKWGNGRGLGLGSRADLTDRGVMRHKNRPDQAEDLRRNSLNPFDSHEFYLQSISCLGESLSAL